MMTGKGYTNRGGREYNEDCGVLVKGDGISYAVIADGLGGHGHGDVASRTAVDTLRECFQTYPAGRPLTEEVLSDWFDQANQRVLAMQDAQCRMRTTLALLCVDEARGTAYTAHLGDSRIYHFVDGKCAFYTFDHSVSRMAVLAGEIEMEQIRFHTDRNKLLKVIGKSEDVKAETKTIELARGAAHAFLLCTDGFWEYVTEEEMEKSLRQADSAEDWLRRMRACLKRHAKEGNDNNSAIAVWIE